MFPDDFDSHIFSLLYLAQFETPRYKLESTDDLDLKESGTDVLEQIIQFFFPNTNEFIQQLMSLKSEYNDKHFPQFVARRDLTLEVIEFTKRTLHYFDENQRMPLVKQNGTVGSMIGASGIGKTRAAMEVMNIVLKEFKDTVEPFFIKWDFTNGGMVRDFERQETGDIECIFGYRIFQAAIGKDKQLLDVVVRKLYARRVFLMDTVMEVLSRYLHKIGKINNSGRIPMMIVVADEYQRLRDSLGKEWKEPLYSLLGYMIETNGKNERLKRDQVCILPFVVGTLLKDMIAFEPTGYRMQAFRISLFGPETIMELVRMKFSRKDCNGNPIKDESGRVVVDEGAFQVVSKSNAWKLLWYESGLVARILQFTIEQVQRTMEAHGRYTEDALLAAVDVPVYNMLQKEYGYPFDNSVNIQPLFDLIFSGFRLNVTEETPESPSGKQGSYPIINLSGWFLDQKLRGSLYQTPNGRVYLARHHLRTLVYQYRTDLTQSLPAIGNLSLWSELERLDLEALVSRLNIFVDKFKENGQISLEWLFPGAFISKELRGLSLDLPSQRVKFGTDTTQFLYTDGQNERKNKRRNKQQNKQQNKTQNKTKELKLRTEFVDGKTLDELQLVVHQCAKDTPLVDGRWVTSGTFNGKTCKVMILLQYKYSQTVEKQKVENGANDEDGFTVNNKGVTNDKAHSTKDSKDPVQKPYYLPNPQQWATTITKEIKSFKPVTDFLIVPVMITNRQVKDKKRPDGKGEGNRLNGDGKKEPFVLVSQECAEEYFSPNLLPLYKCAEDISEKSRPVTTIDQGN